MATPTGRRADQARGWYARERRRNKRDLAEYTRQGITPLAPFDFGAVLAGGQSANALTLPANTTFVLQFDGAAAGIGDFGVTEVGGDTFTNAEPLQDGGFVEIRHRFARAQDVTVFREVGAPAGDVKLYFLEETGGKRTLIGEATAT